MTRILRIIKKKGIGDILLAVSFALCVVSVFAYRSSGITDFNPTLSDKVIVPLVITIILEAVLLVFGSKLGKYACFALLVYAFVEYISTQVNYIVNVFVAIDGYTFTGGFILTLVSLVLATILALVSGIMSMDERKLLEV